MSENTKAAPAIGVKHLTANVTKSDANGLGPREFLGDMSASPIDQCGDVVPAQGCDPQRGDIPLIDSHDVTKVVGRFFYHVNGDRVSGKGVFAPAGIDQNIDRLCALVKAGVVDSLSVGFDVISSEPIPGTRGRTYTAWRPCEVSLVAIPAQPLAKITGKAGGESRANRMALAESMRLDPIERAGMPVAKRYAGMSPEVASRVRYAEAVEQARIAAGHAERWGG